MNRAQASPGRGWDFYQISGGLSVSLATRTRAEPHSLVRKAEIRRILAERDQ